jgi:hypothetical protein
MDVTAETPFKNTEYTGRHDVCVHIAAVNRVRLIVYDKRTRDGRYVDMVPRNALRVAFKLFVTALQAAYRK